MPDALLFDGMNLAHRAWHALRATRPEVPGEEVADLTRSMIERWLTHYQIEPVRALAIFDGRGGTAKRRALYPDYKAGRVERPDALTVALELLPTLLAASGVRFIQIDGWEADDVIATYTRLLSEQRLTSHVVTSDRDLLQAIDPWTTVILPKGSRQDAEAMDVAAFAKRYDFAPRLLADYKALTGDKSDNIAGVPLIGDKTARKLLAQFDGIDVLYRAIDEVVLIGHPPRVRPLLLQFEPAVRLNLRITTLDRRVPGVALRGAAARAA